MEYLTEDNLHLFSNKEWLIKIDNDESKPYLLKFWSSDVDRSCCILITDTVKVWSEVLSSKQVARRWRACNPSHPGPYTDEDEEDSWRSQILRVLTDAHSLGGIEDLSFEIVPSRNADLAFELGSDEFKWRWESYFQGPKLSADILSKHLIIPLISLNHLAFSSADPVSELSEGDLEKAVDKIGRTGRRSLDTHVKHAISRPRLTTTLRRMSAMFNFHPELPPIISSVEVPDLHVPVIRAKSPVQSAQRVTDIPSRQASPVEQGSEGVILNVKSQNNDTLKPASDDSATEPEDDEEILPVLPPQSKGKEKLRQPSSSPVPVINSQRGRVNVSRQLTPEPERAPSKAATQTISSASDSSPVRPAKKKKPAPVSSSSDDDSEAERKKRIARLKSGSSRGAKQPIKRGGKRF